MTMTKKIRSLVLPVALLGAAALVACGTDDGGDDDDDINNPCTVEANYASIHDKMLATPKCAVGFCHDSATASGGLDFTKGAAMVHADLVGAASENVDATKPMRIVASNKADSWFYVKIAESMPPGGRMPSGGALSQCDIDRIGSWIDAGASM